MCAKRYCLSWPLHFMILWCASFIADFRKFFMITTGRIRGLDAFKIWVIDEIKRVRCIIILNSRVSVWVFFLFCKIHSLKEVRIFDVTYSRLIASQESRLVFFWLLPCISRPLIIYKQPCCVLCPLYKIHVVTVFCREVFPCLLSLTPSWTDQ